MTGVDWSAGDTVHSTTFGRITAGNGACALVQFLPDGDMIFTSAYCNRSTPHHVCAIAPGLHKTSPAGPGGVCIAPVVDPQDHDLATLLSGEIGLAGILTCPQNV